MQNKAREKVTADYDLVVCDVV